jgi:hypothetical protein
MVLTLVFFTLPDAAGRAARSGFLQPDAERTNVAAS